MGYLKNEKLLVVIIVYLLITINLVINNNEIYINFVNPLFWGFMLLFLIWYEKRNYIRFNKNTQYLKYLIVIILIHIIIYFYFGLSFGFSKNQYKYEIITTLIPIIGIEKARSVIANRNKKNKCILVFVTVLFILIEINYNTLISAYSNAELFFKYICEIIIPLIACNILCTYLTLLSTFLIPLLYRISNMLVVLFSPILANVDWFTIATTSILSTLLVYIIFKQKFTKKKVDIRKRRQYIFGNISTTIIIFASVIFIGFMIGLFKYQPITILSNSMVPSLYRGDVVIFKKMSDDELKEINLNEIIVYKIGNQNIAHRVINKIKKDNTIFYKTKGDTNSLPDAKLVNINQIKGITIFKIKYVGFPSIWLHEYFNKQDANVEIK